MSIPNEAVIQAVWAAIEKADEIGANEGISDTGVEDIARAALTAAAPTLMAQAWDEGASFAEHSFPEGNNPYRKEHP